MNNRTLMQEMLHCTDMTVLERQRARFKWQEQQEQQQIQLVHEQQQQQLGLLDSCFGDFNGVFQLHHQQQQLGFQGGLGELLTTTQLSSVKPDPNLVDNNMWNDVAGFGPNCGFGDNSIGGSGFEMNFAISRTSSCPPAVAAAAAPAVVKSRDSDVSDKISCGIGRDSFKKRKHDKVQTNPEVVAEEDSRNKKIKICADEGEPKITEKNNNNRSCSSSSNNNNNNNNNNKGTNNIKENSPETSKDNSKVTEVQKLDYIHVRARRGQATDSHSLAERVRREKISERMKYLQDLVPGCNKITGKAGMLDEIINYVQSLQRQVEFLSMKLATVNPRLDFNIDNSFAKEAFPACAPNFSTIGMSSEMTNPAAYLQFNPEQHQQQIVSCGGLDLGINPPDMGPRRTISSPIPVPETTFDSSCFNQIQPSPAWDPDLQNLYNLAFDQARSTTNSFASHLPFTGSVEAGNVKMEM